MAEFPYTPSPANLTRFFSHVQTAGVPPKVTVKYLKQSGFKSSNDTYIPSVLKFIGFLDNTGAPTALWQAYRSRGTARAALAGAIRRAYADLFGTYPDAHRKDNEALRNYFSAHTKVAESTLALIVSTFRKLCELGDFESATPTGASVPPSVSTVGGESTAPIVVPSVLSSPSATSVPAININIQLELPATSDADIYDKLFAALKKHLFTS